MSRARAEDPGSSNSSEIAYLLLCGSIFCITILTVSEDGLKRLAGEFDLEAIMVLDLSDRGTVNLGIFNNRVLLLKMIYGSL